MPRHSSRRLTVASAVLAWLLNTLACPAPEAQPINLSATIEAASGGTVASEGGEISVEIPAGALAEDTTITVEEMPASSLGGDVAVQTAVFDIGPDGTRFATPVTISIAVDTDAVSADTQLAYWDGEALVALPGKGVVDDTLIGTTTHLCLFTGMPCVAGVASCPCRPDAVCNAGLSCQQGICVDASSPVGTWVSPCIDAVVNCDSDGCVTFWEKWIIVLRPDHSGDFGSSAQSQDESVCQQGGHLINPAADAAFQAQTSSWSLDGTSLSFAEQTFVFDASAQTLSLVINDVSIPFTRVVE